jgi:methyl-accepting chemotaxis protein
MDLLTIQIETASSLFTKDELDKDRRVKKLNEIDSKLNELADQVDEIMGDFEAMKASVNQQEQQLSSISDSTSSVLDLLKQLGERVDVLEEFNNDQAMAKYIRNFLLDSNTTSK